MNTQAIQSSANHARRISPNEDAIDGMTERLIGLAAAVAANHRQLLDRIGMELLAAGVERDQLVQTAGVGWLVRQRPALAMKQAVDEVLGTQYGAQPDSGICPAARMERDAAFVQNMLVAVGAAVAANCEPCFGQSSSFLYEAGVAEAAIQRAVEIGLHVKAAASAMMDEAVAGWATGLLPSRTDPATHQPAIG